MKLLLGLLLSLLSANAFACECAIPNLKEALQKADFVIAAKVIAVVDKGPTICHLSPSNNNVQIGYRVKVRVSKKYKGHIKSKTIIVDSGNTDCSICFRAGVEYLIFGSFHNSIYSTNMCTRTAELRGNKDIEELQKK